MPLGRNNSHRMTGTEQGSDLQLHVSPRPSSVGSHQTQQGHQENLLHPTLAWGQQRSNTPNPLMSCLNTALGVA